MGDLFDRMLSPEVLDHAWRLLRGDRAVWAPGVSRRDMEPHFLQHLLTVREEVLDGRYRPAGVRQFPVNKADGKIRVLSALVLRDKLLQRAALTVLDPLAETLFHVDSYAYRRGRGVEGALTKARERVAIGLDWLVDADIRSFFDTIPLAELKRKVRKFVPDRELLNLLDLWIDIGPSRHSLFSKARGIPQGAILSPLLCNLYLHEFDLALTRSGIPFVRYADDLLLFLPDRTAAERALVFADKTLRALDLSLHPDKTRVTRSGPHVSFLGEPMPKPPPPAANTNASAGTRINSARHAPTGRKS
ncbi:MAG: Retron-type reverse transcriptase [Betaproteobacteria bacterium]|nr:Retron-type reverse transcriptase [Betaproteobacteria bacterium]